jgi:hypothetical protein
MISSKEFQPFTIFGFLHSATRALIHTKKAYDVPKLRVPTTRAGDHLPKGFAGRGAQASSSGPLAEQQAGPH